MIIVERKLCCDYCGVQVPAGEPGNDLPILWADAKHATHICPSCQVASLYLGYGKATEEQKAAPPEKPKKKHTSFCIKHSLPPTNVPVYDCVARDSLEQQVHCAFYNARHESNSQCVHLVDKPGGETHGRCTSSEAKKAL